MKPLTTRMADRLGAALTYVLDQRDAEPGEIIAGLIRNHGAVRDFSASSQTYQLRCAGVTSSNTGNSAAVLLCAWRGHAVVRLSIP